MSFFGWKAAVAPHCPQHSLFGWGNADQNQLAECRQLLRGLEPLSHCSKHHEPSSTCIVTPCGQRDCSTSVCLTQSHDSPAQMNISRNDRVPVPSQGFTRQCTLLHLPLAFLLFLMKGFVQAAWIPKWKTYRTSPKPTNSLDHMSAPSGPSCLTFLLCFVLFFFSLIL